MTYPQCNGKLYVRYVTENCMPMCADDTTILSVSWQLENIIVKLQTSFSTKEKDRNQYFFHESISAQDFTINWCFYAWISSSAIITLLFLNCAINIFKPKNFLISVIVVSWHSTHLYLYMFCVSPNFLGIESSEKKQNLPESIKLRIRKTLEVIQRTASIKKYTLKLKIN